MRAHFALLSAALLVAASASAQPAQPETRAGTQADQHRADLVLASADSVRVQAPASDQTTQAPKRPRAARVTTCRCGDPAAAPDDQ